MIRLSKVFASVLILVFLQAASALAVQGQWGGFIYLFPKPGITLSDLQREQLSLAIDQAGADLQNDFRPQKGKTETILFLKTLDYTVNGQDINPKPSGFIRVESKDRGTVERYFGSVSKALQDTHNLEFRLGVTQELKYTDQSTLKRLKNLAPKRGDGEAQPHGIALPLSKTPEWWAMTSEKRQSYFFQHPETFGKEHLGHNAIGFQYISRIFRKLYHSRFIDNRQDFVTYFEYADSDAEAFKKLLDGLRDPKANPEWKFVKEKPLLHGLRVVHPKGIF